MASHGTELDESLWNHIILYYRRDLCPRSLVPGGLCHMAGFNSHSYEWHLYVLGNKLETF